MCHNKSRQPREGHICLPPPADELTTSPFLQQGGASNPLKRVEKCQEKVLCLSEHYTKDEVFICLVSFIRYDGGEEAKFDNFLSCHDILIRKVCFPDVPHLKGQQRIEVFEHILLRLAFPSFYSSYNKSCCKLYPGGCYKLLDSTGYTCDLLKGRVTKTENDGWIEFKISNVRFVDAGYYRCIVLGTQNRIYSDYYVEVSGKQSCNLH